jgi:hypothetical protein
MEEEEYILCEECFRYIDINEYNSHISYCTNYQRNYEQSLRLHSNFQISNGRNLRDFIREHFHVEPSHRYFSSASSTPLGTSPTSIHSNGLKKIDKALKHIPNQPLEPDFECPICMDNIENETKLRKLNCQHIFCYFCLKKWLSMQNFCPLCKTIIN